MMIKWPRLFLAIFNFKTQNMKKYFFLAILLSFGGCSKQKSSFEKVTISYDYNDFENIQELNGTKLDLGLLLSPIDLYFLDSLLYISSVGNDYNLKVFNRSNKEKGQLFYYGPGPSEAMSVAGMSIKNNNSVLIHDLNSNQVKEFEIYASKDSIYSNFINTVTFSKVVYEPFSLGENFSSTVFNINPLNRFYLFDMKGNFVDGKGDFPNFGIDLPTTLFPEVFNTRAKYNKLKEKIVLAYEFTDLVEIYDKNFNLINRIHGPEKFIPLFDVSDGNGVISMVRKYNYTRWAFSQIETTENLIFLLYSGKVKKKETLEEDTHYSQIIVLNWEGIPNMLLKLNHPIITFTVDEKEKLIYGLDRLTSEVYSFKYN